MHALNKFDYEYLMEPKIRRNTRLLFALVIGVLANWTWLILISILFSVFEGIWWVKVLQTKNVSEDDSAYDKGYAKGEAIAQSIALSLRTFFVIAVAASLIKILKELIGI